MDDGQERCRRCASAARNTQQQGQHLGLYCGDCGTWIRWLPQPETLDRALEFSMPWGKHKGSRLGDLDDGYLSWLVENIHENKIRRMARLVYESRAGVP